MNEMWCDLPFSRIKYNRRCKTHTKTIQKKTENNNKTQKCIIPIPKLPKNAPSLPILLGKNNTNRAPLSHDAAGCQRFVVKLPAPSCQEMCFWRRFPVHRPTCRSTVAPCRRRAFTAVIWRPLAIVGTGDSQNKQKIWHGKAERTSFSTTGLEIFWVFHQSVSQQMSLEMMKLMAAKEAVSREGVTGLFSLTSRFGLYIDLDKTVRYPANVFPNTDFEEWQNVHDCQKHKPLKFNWKIECHWSPLRSRCEAAKQLLNIQEIASNTAVLVPTGLTLRPRTARVKGFLDRKTNRFSHWPWL